MFCLFSLPHSSLGHLASLPPPPPLSLTHSAFPTEEEDDARCNPKERRKRVGRKEARGGNEEKGKGREGKRGGVKEREREREKEREREREEEGSLDVARAVGRGGELPSPGCSAETSMGGCVGSHHDSSGSLNENSDGTGGNLLICVFFGAGGGKRGVEGSLPLGLSACCPAWLLLPLLWWRRWRWRRGSLFPSPQSEPDRAGDRARRARRARSPPRAPSPPRAAGPGATPDRPGGVFTLRRCLPLFFWLLCRASPG